MPLRRRYGRRSRSRSRRFRRKRRRSRGFGRRRRRSGAYRMAKRALRKLDRLEPGTTYYEYDDRLLPHPNNLSETLTTHISAYPTVSGYWDQLEEQEANIAALVAANDLDADEAPTFDYDNFDSTVGPLSFGRGGASMAPIDYVRSSHIGTPTDGS